MITYFSWHCLLNLKGGSIFFLEETQIIAQQNIYTVDCGASHNNKRYTAKQLIKTRKSTFITESFFSSTHINGICVPKMGRNIHVSKVSPVSVVP